MNPSLLIVGASVRAALGSAQIAEVNSMGADLFADDDARRLAEIVKLTNYPHGIHQLLALIQPAAWMYCGGLENYPDLVEKCSRLCPLWGNSGDVLRRVRDPFLVTDVLQASGIACPEVVPSSAPIPDAEPWLLKPIRSSGGNAIREIVRQNDPRPLSGPSAARERPTQQRSTYYQQFISGTPCAALFIGAGRHAQLLGVTEQLVGPAWTGAGRFQYAGSIGGWTLSQDEIGALQEIGRTLAAEFALTGLFGVDAIYADGTFMPVEINPRYTASTEILERFARFSAIAWHVDACRHGKLPSRERLDAGKLLQAAGSQPLHGKAILFARQRVSIGPRFHHEVRKQNRSEKRAKIADIPALGSRIEQGWPITTLFGRGRNRDEVREHLRESAGCLEEILYQDQ